LSEGGADQRCWMSHNGRLGRDSGNHRNRQDR
jgi:hypothetical protein